ncbi:hypothetical protein GCM10028794_24150 [Silanimonas algicola]
MRFMKLAQQLLDALRIARPRHPGLIRGGLGRLPRRTKRPRHPVCPPDAPQRMAASRAVRRLFKNLRIPLAKGAPRAHMKGDSE